MENLSDMNLEKFKLWTTNALRVFLALRKKQVNGNFDELAARAFCAWEENVLVDTNAEHEQRKLLAEYQDKLRFADETVSDPLSLKTGWLNETNGMKNWPAVYLTDISKYLNTRNSDDLMNRLLNEYKEGKAFRYFTEGWVKEVYYQDIGDKGDKCVVKSKVTPSQAVNRKAYDTWIIIRKEFNGVQGGEIVGAYCTCTAGMLGSCNHIAGVLFRIDYAVKTGMTKSTCTDRLSEWNRPKGRTVIKPGKVSNFVWKKSSYTETFSLNKEKDKQNKRKAFTPMNKFQQEREAKYEPNNIRNLVYQALKEDVPNSCMCLMMERRRIDESPVNKKDIPPTLFELSRNISNDLTLEQMKTEFFSSMEISEQQIYNLASATMNQSDSALWKEQRRGRLTASLFHRLSCRSKSLQKDCTEDATSVVDLVMGTRKNIQTTAMKHGISVEPHAKKSYKAEMKTKHKNFRADSTGMHVYKDQPFISASPDLLVDCTCCGDGLCEIKCPESIKDQVPCVKNLPYLVRTEDNTVVLKTKHPYYYQVQGQLGITGRNYCDLYIFTFHGSVVIRIQFDKDFFLSMISNLSWFWQNHIFPEILKSGRKKAKRALKEIVDNQ